MGGTIIITGANGSLALGFIEAFLQSYSQHTLIAAVRNPSTKDDPNTANLAKLLSKYPNTKSYIESVDLASLADVRSFAEKITDRVSSQELPPIASIICNAFTWSLEAGQKFTSDGIEATFQVCHLSHYLLILKLLESMDPKSGRIVMLGSTTHYDLPNPISSLVAALPENLEELVKPEQDPPQLIHDRGFQRYSNAKLANVVFTYDLNKRLQKNAKLSEITVTAMDPGGLPGSRAQAGQKKFLRAVFAVVNPLMPILKHLTSQIRTTADAGRDLAYVSLDPSFQGRRGYFEGKKETAPSKVATDEKMQQDLWDSCWRWANLTSEGTALQ